MSKMKCTPVANCKAGVVPPRKTIITKEQRKSVVKTLRALLETKEISRKEYETLKALTYMSAKHAMSMRLIIPDSPGEYARYHIHIVLR